MKITIPITPVPKPRQTRRDKWAKRDCVMRYRAFADELRLRLGKTVVPDGGAHITFVMPMPKSWPQKKREAMDGRPHRQVPDVDNLLKAVNDALHKDDAGVWDARVTKYWGQRGALIIDIPDEAVQSVDGNKFNPRAWRGEEYAA